METRSWAAGTQRSRASPMVLGSASPWTQDSSLFLPHKAPGGSSGNAFHRHVPASRGRAVLSGNVPALHGALSAGIDVRPAAAAESPERGRPLAGDLRGPAGGTEARPKPPACRAAGPASQSGQRQGPESAASFRSHVSRRRRLKMMEASWHRGESWNPGRKRSGAEAAISSSGDPRLLAAPPHATPPLPPTPAPSPSPAGYPLRARHSQLSAFGDASWVPAGTSLRNLAAPARAGGGTGGKPRRRRDPVSHRLSPRASQPSPADNSGTRIVSGRVGAPRDRWDPGDLAEGPESAEQAGAGCRVRGPGAGALTQATTSLLADASSSRVGATPGNSSGLGRLLSTAWASERPRATRRSRAHDCGDLAELETPRPPPCPPATPTPRRPAGLTQGSGGTLRGRKEQFRGLQLSISSSWAGQWWG